DESPICGPRRLLEQLVSEQRHERATRPVHQGWTAVIFNGIESGQRRTPVVAGQNAGVFAVRGQFEDAVRSGGEQAIADEREARVTMDRSSQIFPFFVFEGVALESIGGADVELLVIHFPCAVNTSWSIV